MRAACPRSEAPLLSPVVMVQEAAHDVITAAFLLTQSLRQRQEEVEDAAMEREEDVEEDDRLVEYFSEDCVFLEMLRNEWQSCRHGVARLLRHSNGAVIFQFWQGEQLIVDDVVQVVGRPRLKLRPVRGGGGQEQVIVQAIPRVVGSLPPCEVSAPVFDQVHQEQLAAGVIPENMVEISVVRKNRRSFRQFLVSLIHILLLQSLLSLCTTLSIRNSFLLVRRL